MDNPGHGEQRDLINGYFGRMNDPVVSAFLKGPCGDEMEFYLVIENDVITDIRFYTEGCEATKSCGAMTCFLVKGKAVEDALRVSAGEVYKNLKGLPAGHRHCSILVSCPANPLTFEGLDLRQFASNGDAGIPSAVCLVGVRRKLTKDEPSLRAEPLLPGFCVAEASPYRREYAESSAS